MKKVLLLCSIFALLVAPLVTNAQDEEGPTFSLSGSVDAYFHESIGSEDDAPATAFSNLPGFSLGMVNLIGSYEGEKAGFVADLVFGPRGEDAVFASGYYALLKGNPANASSQIVNQLYAYWKPSESVTLTLGNFNTFLGYEVISPAVNFNYSTSYMFSYGPFSHTGLKANFEFGSGSNVMLAVMNPTDLTEFNPVDTYTLGAQYGYSNDAGGLWINLLYGDQNGKDNNDEATFQVDLTTGWNLGESFYLGANATYNTTSVETGDAGSFMGFALYPQLTLSESTSIGLRGEYFAFTNGYLGVVASDTNGDGNVIDLTLSLNHKVGNLTIIPEVRIDMAGEETWVKKDESSPSMKSLPTATVALVYSF